MKSIKSLLNHYVSQMWHKFFKNNYFTQGLKNQFNSHIDLQLK